MLDPTFLEIANGVLAVSGFMLLIIFGRYLWMWTPTERGRRAAVAIAVYVLGETMFRAWVWLWRHQQNDGVPVDWMRSYPVAVAGLGVAVIGGFCMMRVFSLSRIRPWVWMVVMVVTVISMTAVALM